MIRAVFLMVAGLLAGVSPAKALTAEELQGRAIEATAVWAQKVSHGGREFESSIELTLRLRIDNGGRISGTLTRVAPSPRGPLSRSDSISGVIGKPGTASSGQGQELWILEGNKLVRLRTFQTGGTKVEIAFSGQGGSLGCSLRSAMVREVGAGDTARLDSIPGGKMTILSARQTSSRCRVS